MLDFKSYSSTVVHKYTRACEEKTSNALALLEFEASSAS